MSSFMDIDDTEAGRKRLAEDFLDSYLAQRPRVIEQYGSPGFRANKRAFVRAAIETFSTQPRRKRESIMFAIKRAWDDWEESGTPQRARRIPGPLNISDIESERIDDQINRMVSSEGESLIQPEEGINMSTTYQSLATAQPTYVRAPKSLQWTRKQRLNRYGPSMASAAMRDDASTAGSWYQNRLEDQYYGRGAYKKRKYGGRGKYTFGSFIRDVESVGRRAEPTLNRFMTKGIPRIAKAAGVVKGMMGRGMYSGRGMYGRNVLIEGGTPSLAAGTGSPDNQEVIISHCEYLQDVYGPTSANFSNNQLDLNPGILENFPFLAQIAANYEEYEFIQLVFHFKSTVDASNSTTGAVGTLIMATNYNADAAPFLSKESMMQYHGANNTRLDQGMDHGVECDPTKNAGSPIKFVRILPIVDGQQKKEFDLGKFQWAIVNIPSHFQNQQLGELWCSYTVKLAKPKLAVSLGRTIACDKFISNGGESTTSFLGTGLLQLSQNSIGCELSETTPGANQVDLKITFPDFCTGSFEIQVKKNSTDQQVASTVVAGNVELVEDIWNNAQYVSVHNFGKTGAGDDMCSIIHVKCAPATAGVDNTITVKYNQVDATAFHLDINPYNPDLKQTEWVLHSDKTTVVVPS